MQLGCQHAESREKIMMGTLGCEAERAATRSKTGEGGGIRLPCQAGGAGKGCVWLYESKDLETTEILRVQTCSATTVSLSFFPLQNPKRICSPVLNEPAGLQSKTQSS